MTSCDACGRDFTATGGVRTCPYCGFNTHPRSKWPRSLSSLLALAQERREEQEEQDELNEYFDLEGD